MKVPDTHPRVQHAAMKTPLEFLRYYCPDGPWQLTAIIPDGKPPGNIETRTFTKAEGRRAAQWVKRHNTEAGIYFTVNPRRDDANPNKKPSKKDIKSLDWLWVDCDARPGEDLDKARARTLEDLRNYKIPPTFIIMSGNGHQGFWRLNPIVPVEGDTEAERLAHIADLERYSRHLEHLLAGDSCHNIDRVMRLPGTVNFPNAVKIAKGCVEVLATLAEAHEGRSYPLDDFTPAPSQEAAGAPSAPGQAPSHHWAQTVDLKAHEFDFDKSPLSEHMNRIVLKGYDPADPDRYASRSEGQFACTCQMVRKSIPPEVILAALLDEQLGISACVRDKKPNERQYAARQIDRARSLI